jgi:hypothetical protein
VNCTTHHICDCNIEKMIRLEKWIAGIKKCVDIQAEDEGLWYIAESAPEAYVQQALRSLHEVIEDETKLERALKFLKELKE